MEKKSYQSDFDNFIGKWKVNSNGESAHIEFCKGGSFNCYDKGFFQKLLIFNEEYNQIWSLHKTVKMSSTWNIKNGKLVLLITNREETYSYSFSDNNQKLILKKDETGEELILYKESSETSIGSLVSWYSTFRIKSFLIGLLLCIVLLIIGILFSFLIVIILAGIVGIVTFLIIWFKIIIPKLKS